MPPDERPVPDRKALLAGVKTVVVKAGTRVLTNQSNKLDVKVIERLADSIAELRRRKLNVALVSSGAIGAGMASLALKQKPKAMPRLQAIAAVGQNQLMHYYKQAFQRQGLIIAQVLLTADDVVERYLNVRSTFRALFDYGAVPIVNENDSVATEEIKVGDNDTLSAQVANIIEADLLVMLSDVEGLHSGDPRKQGRAQLIPVVTEITPEIEALAGKAGSEMGIGGMRTKIAAAKMLTRVGEMVVIAHGKKHNLVDIMDGQPLGTLFLPSGDRLTSRKRRIAFVREKKGTLMVDQGAADAVVSGGKSLLPSGIVDVRGEFGQGDMVGVVGPSGEELARGLVNYTWDDVWRIRGKNSREIERILGHRYYDEVIHRDNLVVL